MTTISPLTQERHMLRHSTLVAALIVAAFTSSGPPASAAPPAPVARACGVACGTERWPVKTLTDSDWTPTKSVVTSVGALRAFHAPPRDSLGQFRRYGAVERTTWTVNVVVVGWKLESDQDFHIVVADPDKVAATMIVEVPNPRCARMCLSPAVDRVTAVRASVIAALGKPSARYRLLTPPRAATVTGVGFLDFIHGQTGVAPNGVELHPVTGITFTKPPTRSI